MSGWWNRRTVGQRLSVVFATMVTLIVIVATTAFVSARAVQHNVDDIFTVRLPALDALVEADRDLQQLLVAERSLIFAEPGTELFEKFVKDYEENLQQSDDRFQRYRKLAATAADQPTIRGYEQARRDWIALSRQVIDQRRANTPEGRTAAIDMTLGHAREKFDAMREFLNTAQERNLEVAGQQYKEAVATYNRVRMLMMLLGAISVLAGVGLSLLVGKTLSRQIRELALGLRSGAGQVVSAANELSSTAQVLSQGASEQAATLEESSASMEEMSSMTSSTEDHVMRAASLMDAVSSRVDESTRALAAMETSMEGIRDANSRVSRIIKTIDEIAFQTNILALNAAVEAARAGEAGMGFAVVADEVRSLAQRAAQAARDTTALIEETLSKTSDGADNVSGVTSSLRSIVDSFGELHTLVSQVRIASQQQTQGISQVTQGVAHLEKSTQSTAASAEESAAASEELYAQAQHALGLVLQLEALAGVKDDGAAPRSNSDSGADIGANFGGSATRTPRSRAMLRPVSRAVMRAVLPLMTASALLGGGAVRTARAQTPPASNSSARATTESTTSTTSTGSTSTSSANTGSSAAPADASQPAPTSTAARVPQRPAAAAPSKPHRWVDVQVAQLDARYRFMDTSAGVTTANQMQQRETFRAGVKFDEAGRYSLQIGALSGPNFNASWDTSGPGTGDTNLHMYMRQLYLAAVPIKGVEVQFGGIGFVRGESTEVTSYDNDGFMVGERISVKRRKQTHLDEIAFTVGHLGDLNTPNVFRRFDGLKHHNFAQVLTSRKFGARASASADWTAAGPEDTFHEAIRLGVKESRIVDGVRLEFYERVTGVTGKGFAASVDRALSKAFTMSGGYATVDRAAVLNGDRFTRGRRGFVEGRYAVTPEVTLSAFFTRAFRNDFAIPNGTRLDVVVTYNVLKGLQRAGAW
jgi:methyl-accepting chemotaxis protein